MPLKSLAVIGLNSGTSMDGIDAALFRITPSNGTGHARSVPSLEIEHIESLLEPFEPSFQRHLQSIVSDDSLHWEDVCLLNTALGEVFARAAVNLIKKAKPKCSQVDLIGSHGQTIWHAPKKRPFWGVRTSGTLQLGEPSVIALRTGLPVVADFRPADVAAGGEGAPLVAFADEVLFGNSGFATGVLNIGGIANITVIEEAGRASMAFDTGPGNMLIDRAAQKLYGMEFDGEGKLAAAGKINDKWLQELLAHPYFRRLPPKTTGREDFGNFYADELLAHAESVNMAQDDIMATLTALTACSIADAYKTFVLPATRLNRLILGGGGAENAFLMRLLTKEWPHPVDLHKHEDFGVSTKFKEALLFALLAYTTYYEIPNNVPVCTGARRRVCLGKLVHP